MLGNHLPRQCGIATFTADLTGAIAAEYPALDCFVMAMNDGGQRYAYPPRVRFEIEAAAVASYRRAADFLNVSSVDLISVQHEYGIFGGEAGAHVLALLRDLPMPIVTTLHTILAEPNPLQRVAMNALAAMSERLVVMSSAGAALLREVHGVSEYKIDVVPHGIPVVPDATESKHALGVEGKTLILTFGLLSPSKGIEHVIDALPAILETHPDTLYIVLGATHPHVKAEHGEAYRLALESRAQRLGVAAHVLFDNRFVSQDELTRFLSAADLYITPYLDPEQSTSGTLAYAVGSGKAVISTPYAYARELLANGRGVLVPWPVDDPAAIGRAVNDLLGNEQHRTALCQRGAAYGQHMLWPDVARTYVRSFEQARAEHLTRRHTVLRTKARAERPIGLPELSLEHVRRLSDHTGILQHAVFAVPRYEDGYCVDDNARALLLATRVADAGLAEREAVRDLASRYLAFVSHAFDTSNRRFRNFMSYSRQWRDELGSEDCHGRALWALGTVIGRAADPGRRGLADSLFHAALLEVQTFTSPRAWAYALLGIDEYLQAFAGDNRVQALYRRLAERLLDLYQRASTADWPWFEDRATYCNARLSQALLVAGARLPDEAMTAAGLRSLGWLSDVQRAPGRDGYFAPIGSNGFYPRGGEKASFDQQPVEAWAMVSASLAAQRATGDARWAADARRVFGWFLGHNQLHQTLYDAATGGCRDGLHAERVNENQGAESTLSFALSLVEMRAAAQGRRQGLGS